MAFISTYDNQKTFNTVNRANTEGTEKKIAFSVISMCSRVALNIITCIAAKPWTKNA
jgi:hypothetical protein